VTDLLKGLTGGGWAAVYAWIFPSGLIIGAFWLFAYPQITGPLHQHFEALSGPQQAGVLLGLACAVGLVLNAISTPLYRMLEGYAWPKALRDYGIKKQKSLKKRLKQEVHGQLWEEGLRLERLSRFPVQDDEVAPSRLGNAIRAFETYGATRYGLDSQVLWNELCSVVPKYLQDELDRSRAGVDFFVALFYLSGMFGIAVIWVSLSAGGNLKLVILAMLAFGSLALWYKMAIIGTSYWKTNVQALVNLGRKKLADEMGLQIPASLDDERVMWGLLAQFVYSNDEASAKALGKYRKAPTGPD
jgi:hypothetical protein